jgi:hypothetical protein
LDDRLQYLLGRFRAIFGRITVNSAANPSLWLCVVSLLCFSLAYLTNDGVFRWGLFGIGALPAINALVTIQRFLWTEPRYLRSEDHHLRSQLAERLGDESNQLEVAQVLLNPPETPATARRNKKIEQMGKEPKIYALLYDRDSVDIEVLHAFIATSPMVQRWWHYIKSCYLIKSDKSASEIADALPRSMRDGSFLVVEVDLKNGNGWLTDKAWEWIHLRQEELQV